MQSSGEPRGVARLLPKVARALERSSDRMASVSRGNAASFLAFLRQRARLREPLRTTPSGKQREWS